ncbi:hypothetical protein [Mycoplasma sp. 2634B]|uniref:hypothetical protein n=1 Tax=Mycoplasma sp. 2634B TaxID=3401692 RepID=UPI003AAF8BE4
MKLKLTLIPLLGASAILPLVAAQCTEQKDTNKPQTPSTDTQDKPSKPNPSTGSETSGGNTESNPSTSTPEKPNTDSNSGQSNPSDSQQGTTTGGANSGNNTETNPTPGTDSQAGSDSSEGSDKKPGTNEGDKPSQGTTDSKNDSVTEAITILKKFANESTPIKTLMLTLKDNYNLIEKAIKFKFPKEDDVPYSVTEFMDLVKNLVTNYKIDQFDDETRKYMIPGSHGTTITKSQIVYKIKNILIPELSGEAAE